MSMTPKTMNADADGQPLEGTWCEYCGNTGVCVLEGQVKVGGAEYSMGSAPCRWCDQGVLRAKAWGAPSALQKAKDMQGHVHVNHHRRITYLTDYAEDDVLKTAAEPRRGDGYTPDAAFCRRMEELWRTTGGRRGGTRAGMQAILPRQVWPAEWDDNAAPAVAALEAPHPSPPRQVHAATMALNRAEVEERDKKRRLAQAQLDQEVER